MKRHSQSRLLESLQTFRARPARARIAGLVAALLALVVASREANAQSFTVLHAFTNAPDGSSPAAGLLQGPDGNFYGTTRVGGANDLGTVFRITAGGALTILHSFTGPEGFDPLGELVLGTDGNFYGTTALGGNGIFNGNGVVFRMTPAGVTTALHVFTGPDGRNPSTALLRGADGNFYGTTTGGGANDAGTVFRVSPSGAFTTLHAFTGADGGFPLGTLIAGADGNFYGTTANGGSANGGTTYRISPAGVFTSLHSFTFAAGDGNDPRGALVRASDGNF